MTGDAVEHPETRHCWSSVGCCLLVDDVEHQVAARVHVLSDTTNLLRRAHYSHLATGQRFGTRHPHYMH
jgi:hypothetical protein